MKMIYYSCIIVILLMITSCNTLYQIPPGTWIIKSQFKKEILLVKEILNNPDKIKEIVESSEFYDPRFQFFVNENYKYFESRIKEMSSVELEKILVRYGTVSENHIILRNTKTIEVDEYLLFIFYEFDNKILLFRMSTYIRY